jgi:hypothetical protein
LIIAGTHPRREYALCRAALEAAALTLREATPNAETLIMCEGVFKTLLADIA